MAAGAAAFMFALYGAAPVTIVVRMDAPSRPFPHFWEQVFGSGRAILSLRESYRQDLRATKAITGFRYVRFHGILDDEVGIDPPGGVYNFTYFDQIYDGLLANGVRPFVELSFMPSALASSQKPHVFWYKPLPNPPADYDKWGELVYQFASHALARYGAAEVRNWYFEVWNEPNIDFWTGDPKQATYFELYDAAARAIKRADPQLRVGGPATAQAAWVGDLIRHSVEGNVPLDFVSTHVYGNDTADNVLGTQEHVSRAEMVARAVRKVHDEVASSARPNLPIHFTEYNASYMTEPDVEDAPFMGPWLANNIRQCDGLVTTMSYWTFSDVFEEGGVAKTPFYGGYGLIAVGHIPKAAFNAFALLHRLGAQRLPVDSDAALVTKTASGGLAMAVWNYWAPEETGQERRFRVQFTGKAVPSSASVVIIDANHGSPQAAWRKMGSPASPSREQQAVLRHVAAMPAPAAMTMQGGILDLRLPPHALAFIEVK